jgi:biopolymer transport protein TolR
MGMSSGSGSSKSRMSISEINVTPLVDVMLVLLIIFMVTAPMMQQGIDVDLPQTAAGGVQPSEDPFLVVISKDGQINVGSTVLSKDVLQTKIKAIFQTRRNKQIYIQADRSVDYGVVAEVMGEIRAAGITSIGLITLPKN